jgi:2-amino-4-deoxychorismate synthase
MTKHWLIKEDTSFENLGTENPFVLVEQDGIVSYATGTIHKLADLQALKELQEKTKEKIFFLTPFSLAEREDQGLAHGDESILGLAIENEIKISKEKMLSLLPDEAIQHGEIKPDISAEKFWKMVEQVLEEIKGGNICQCIISREFQTVLQNFSPAMLLTLYKKLLGIDGSYMTFMFNTWEQVYTWASPEMHLKVTENTVEKRPIAGTMAKKYFDEQWEEKSFFDRLVEFLKNPKEEKENLMVTDEELKMILKFTEWWKIKWPLVTEIGAVIHTENHFIWKRKKGMEVLDIFKETLNAPTLVGSPLKSAFEIIKNMEESSRGYYGWAFWYLDGDTMDTCIAIRMAVLNNLDSENVNLSVRAGAGIVSDSTPEWETVETENKAKWFLWILENQKTFESYLEKLTPDQKQVIQNLLEERKNKLSDFYTKSQDENLEVEKIKGKKFVIINNDDDFVFMLKYMITRMGGEVEVIENEKFNKDEISDDTIVVLWPWPGDINDKKDQKMLKLLELTKYFQEKNQKMIWICLGHQAICKHNGMDVKRQDVITQWVQKEIDLFWEKKVVWYYNSFSPIANGEKNNYDVVEWERMMYRQKENQVSMQFHPESIMSKDGFEILKESILGLFWKS